MSRVSEKSISGLLRLWIGLLVDWVVLGKWKYYMHFVHSGAFNEVVLFIWNPELDARRSTVLFAHHILKDKWIKVWIYKTKIRSIPSGTFPDMWDFFDLTDIFPFDTIFRTPLDLALVLIGCMLGRVSEMSKPSLKMGETRINAI